MGWAEDGLRMNRLSTAWADDGLNIVRIGWAEDG